MFSLTLSSSLFHVQFFFLLTDKMPQNMSLNMTVCVSYLHFGRFHFIKQGLFIDWLASNQLAVCAFVWLVDPLHVGPPAPGPLTHIIKGKGLAPSIRTHKDEGHIIICLTWSPLKPPSLPVCTSSSPVVGVFWETKCVLYLRDIVSRLTKSFPSGQDVHPSVWGFTCQNSHCVSPASTPTESTCPQPLLISACLHNTAQYGFGYNSA